MTQHTHAHAHAHIKVRLLTGIGRFRDMGYIVDALLINHHFELLLQKDLENVSKHCMFKNDMCVLSSNVRDSHIPNGTTFIPRQYGGVTSLQLYAYDIDLSG